MKRVKLTLVTAVVFALVCAVSFAASSIDWSEANEEGLAQFVFEVIESDQAELENGEVSADMYSILYERSAIEALKDSEHYIANNDPENVVSQETVLTSESLKAGNFNVAASESLEFARQDAGAVESFISQGEVGSAMEIASADIQTGTEWSAIPEPTTALFGIFGVVALAVARRRMKSRE